MESRSTRLLRMLLSFRNCPAPPLHFLLTFNFYALHLHPSSVPQCLSKVLLPLCSCKANSKTLYPSEFFDFFSIPQLLLMFVYFPCEDLESVPLLCFSKPGLCRNLRFLTDLEYFTNHLGYYYFHIYHFKSYWLPKDLGSK